MSFLQRLNEMSKPTIKTVEFDFGKGDGIEKVTVRDLPYAMRQKLIQGRLKKSVNPETGKASFNLDLAGEALYLDAEIIANTLCDEDGKTVQSLAQVKEWDGDLVGRLSKAISEKIGLFSDTEGAANPSPGQS